jgi:beta-lactamase regulating signal transducer with metallopeptidase domain
MIREIFPADSLLWNCVWLSTIFLVVGLAGSFILRHRPSRSHQVLFLAIIAAAIVPMMSTLVKHYELGLFLAKPIAIKPQVEGWSIASNHETRGLISTEVTVHKPSPIEDSRPAKVNSESARFPWRSIITYGWILASVILAGRLLITFILGARLLDQAVPLECERIEQAVHTGKVKLGIKRDIKVYSNHRVRSPVIWCWRRKLVLLVPNVSEHYETKIDWISILCHELAHWKRRDHINGLLAELAVCLLPWQPLLWWAKSRLISLSEQACDDWVVASGQSGTDYAESLLNLIPKAQMAFVPAVVRSKKNLADRVHRILQDSCSNPQTGTIWALSVSIVTVCIAVGVAFAQARPLQLTGTIKTKVGPSATIEQPAFPTVTIKGRILDPNNEPAHGARIIALPVTSCGADIAPNNKNGHFELSWSPTWIDEGQAIYLIATNYQQNRNEAAFVEISDPTLPVTVKLEPALMLEAKVVGPSGRHIAKYNANLSLLTEFKCQAPISETTVGVPRTCIFNTVPYGPKYKLILRAEGYQIKQVIVDTTDRIKKSINLGTITLQRQYSTKSVVTEQKPNPNLAKEFHGIYHLDEKEVAKFIKAPFVLGRQEYLHTVNYDSINELTPLALQHGSCWQAGFNWDDKLIVHSGYITNSPRLWWILRLVMDIPEYDFNIPKELNVRLPYGDWIIRADSSVAEQLKALEEILYAETNRTIRFEKRTAERDTIIVTGRYSFKPLSKEFTDRLCISADDKTRLHKWEVDSLSELFRFISGGINIAIDDRTEPSETGKIRCVYDPDLLQPFRESWTRNVEQKLEKELPILLDNIAKQTGLQFKVERRPVETWFVTEQED